MDPQSAPERYQNKCIFTRLLDGVENDTSKLFVLLMLFILSGSLSGFWVRNRPRAPKPWILFERQAADLGVFLENRIPEPSIFLRFNLVF